MDECSQYVIIAISIIYIFFYDMAERGKYSDFLAPKPGCILLRIILEYIRI